MAEKKIIQRRQRHQFQKSPLTNYYVAEKIMAKACA